MATSKPKKEEKPAVETKEKAVVKTKAKAPSGEYIVISRDSLSAKEAEFIDKLAERLKMSPSAVALAFVHMSSQEGARRGVGFYAPRVRRFSR